MPSLRQRVQRARSHPAGLARVARGAAERAVLTHPRVEAALKRHAQRLYYYAAEVDPQRTWRNTHWMGVPLLKCPLDLWVYQELIAAERPDLIIETGTNRGGSALYMAALCELVGHGQIVTIDIEPVLPQPPAHERITYITASSTAPVTLEEVRRRAADLERVWVILDSDHSEAHVRAELELYADLVTPGGYLIVEDTNVNGHPSAPEHGPGPMEALRAWLATGPPFAPDPSCERFLVTLNPGGFLRREA
jgi:cephalosporin hydroxylase